MAKLTTDEIIDALKEMTLLEASELVKAIEDTFGVSAAAPAAVVAAPDRKSTRLNSSHSGESRMPSSA